LFGPAREAAGVSSLTLSGSDVASVIAAAEARFGEQFARVMGVSRVWLNGDEVERSTHVTDQDELAVIPPVSGG
jgi:molybdopterin converting factor small subunit